MFAVTLLLLLGSPASADEFVEVADHRPCVTQHELWTTPGGLSRSRLEHRWEVAGRGERVTIPASGPGWVYPLCDRPSALAVARFEPGFGLVEVGRLGKLDQ